MQKIAICCPAYKESLTSEEFFNLKITDYNNQEIDKYFIISKSISKNNFTTHFPEWKFIEIDDIYFQNIASYNKYLLSNSLYKIFLDYKFILIYQFDAVLVKNVSNITEQYDYIGAPWLNKIKFYGFNLQVGNGGLSLRNVRKFYLLTTLIWFLKKSNSNEDIIYSLLGKLCLLKIPNFKIANMIFKETSAFYLNHVDDSYGFHALNKWNLKLQTILHTKIKNEHS
jgi:hypothetical protein